MRRVLQWCVVLGVLLASTWYLLALGWPFPTHPGRMFYAWRLGERGWAYWSPEKWSDESNNRLIMDFSRNLIAFGPAAAIDKWETHRTHVIFAANSEHPVRIDECGNRLLLIGRSGKYAALEIPAGAAARLRGALGAEPSPNVQAALTGVAPGVAEALADFRERNELSTAPFPPRP